MPRYSENKGHVNNNGLLLLDFCKQTGVRIMNGRVRCDREIGKYTFVGSRGSSVVDYALSSQDLFNYISQFQVKDSNILSNHCLIIFLFEFYHQDILSSNVEDYKRVKGKYIWKHDFKDQYQDALQFSTSEKLTTSNTKITECSSNDDIQTCLSDFSRIIDDISSPIFKNVKQKYGEEISYNTSSNRSVNT